MVLYCSLEFAEGSISNAEITTGTSFSFSVTNFLGNAEVFLVVLYCSLEFAEGSISNAEITIGPSFSFPVTDLLGSCGTLLLVEIR